MAVPDFQTFLRPMLEAVSDGNAHKIRDLAPVISAKFKLTDADLADLLPSGMQTRFINRVQWAATFLNAAKLIERKSRGVVAITDRGRSEFASAPPRITVQYLMKYPEFRIFRGYDGEGHAVPPAVVEQSESVTPAEQIEIAYQNIRKSLAIELLEKVKTSSPAFFERLVVDLLVRMGYGGSRADAGQAIGKSGDDGIDGIIKEDRLGLDLVAIQAKRKDSTVRSGLKEAWSETAGRRTGSRYQAIPTMASGPMTANLERQPQSERRRIVIHG